MSSQGLSNLKRMCLELVFLCFFHFVFIGFLGSVSLQLSSNLEKFRPLSPPTAGIPIICLLCFFIFSMAHQILAYVFFFLSLSSLCASFWIVSVAIFRFTGLFLQSLTYH